MSPQNPDGPSGKSPGSGKPRPARAGWRSHSTQPQRREPGTASRGWWKARQSEPGKNVGFRIKLAVSTVLLGGLIALYVIFVLRFPTKVPLIALHVTDYATELLPPNSWTAEDCESFVSQLNDRGGPKRGQGNVAVVNREWLGKSPTAALEELRELLRDAKPGGPDKNVILVYISAHGVVNDKNEPCLLLARSNPLNSETWLRLPDLFNELHQNKSVKTLLVLDCNRIDSNWSCGLLYNNFADALEELVRKTEEPHLVVLNSTSPGETGVAAPELGGSVFGYFFCQGLNGAAARQNKKEVYLQDLATYLQREVNQWVIKHRVGSQRPQVLRADGDTDFALAYSNPTGSQQDQEENKRLAEALQGWRQGHAGDWRDVDLLWKQHDELKKDKKLYRFDPLGWAQFERNLLRLEQLLLGGPAYQKAAGDLKTKLRIWASDALKNVPTRDIAVYSLPAERLSTGSTQAEQPSEPQASADPGQPKSDDDPTAAYFAKARSQWDGLVKKDRFAVDDAGAALEKPGNRPGKPEIVELHFLRLLKQHLDAPAAPDVRLLALAIRSRDQAERAAMPSDERAHYWITDGVDRADDSRRRAEDLVFVDSPNARELKKNWDDAKAGYDSSQALGEQAADAFDARDRGWADAPYLMQWLWSRRTLAQDGASDRSSTRALQREQLLNGIRGLHSLSFALDKHLESTTDNGWKATLQPVLDLRLLVDEFQNQSSELEKAPSNQDTLVAIARHLSSPLDDAASRRALREKYLTILEELGGRGNILSARGGQPTSGSSPAVPTGKDSGLDPTDLPTRPLLELLSRDWLEATPPPSDVAAQADAEKPTRSELLGQLAPLGGRVRNLLGEVDSKSNELLRASDDLLQKNAEEKPAETKFAPLRAGRGKADRLVRAAAALYEKPATDPTRALRQLDLHQFMLWQCQRTLEDFWGPADPNQSGESYFQTVARDYLKTAENFCTVAQGLRQTLQDRLDKRAAAAKELLTATSARSLIVGKDDKQPIELQLSFSQAPDLPPGIAAVYLRDKESPDKRLVPLITRGPSDASPSKIRRIPVHIPPEKAAARLDQQKPDRYRVARGNWSDNLSSQPLEAVALYRGHLRPQSLRVVPSGVQIEYQPDKPQPTTITVYGDQREPTSVMFIFDCSYSMKELIRGEGGNDVTRLNAARNVLKQILEQLKKDNENNNQFQIGLRIYGHRWTYSNVPDPNNPGKYRRVPAPARRDGFAVSESGYASNFPQQAGANFPGADVETAQSVGSFHDNELKKLDDRLDRLEPWGQTPLNLAIWHAANEDFRKNEHEKRIVVITDGFNEQAPETPLEFKKTTVDVKQAILRDHAGIKLDIVGMGSDFAKENLDFASMKQIAKDSGGAFYPAATAKDLLTHLQNSLSLGKFIVERTTGGSRRDRAELKLNETWPEPSPLSQKTGYRIKVVDVGWAETPSAQVWLEGGEAQALYLEKANRALVHHRYDPDHVLERYFDGLLPADRSLDRFRLRVPAPPMSKPRNLAGPAPPDQFWIAAHKPELDKQHKLATFFISLENFDAKQFSPRPAEAWIEITPLLDNDERGEVYRFCDLDFVPGKPVPVLRCKSPDFPVGGCKEVQIELWCKLEKTPPDKILTVMGLKRQYDLKPAGVRLSAEISDEADAEGNIRVIVSESRIEQAGEFEPGMVKVEMDPANAPVKVVHDYNAGGHTFYFPAAQKGTIDDYRVSLTSRENLRDGAIHGVLPVREVSR
jgi:hypothetical protein